MKMITKRRKIEIERCAIMFLVCNHLSQICQKMKFLKEANQFKGMGRLFQEKVIRGVNKNGI